MRALHKHEILTIDVGGRRDAFVLAMGILADILLSRGPIC